MNIVEIARNNFNSWNRHDAEAIAAEQTNIPDPQLREQLIAFEKKYDEAFNNNDAAAVAVFFTHN